MARSLTEYVLGFAFARGARLDGTQNVALIRKARPAWQKGLLNGIGGKIEPGETPEFAMGREFREETGYQIGANRFDLYAALTGPQFKVYVFRAFGVALGNLKTTTDEVIEIWPVENLQTYAALVDNIRWLVPLAVDLGPLMTSVAFGRVP